MSTAANLLLPLARVLSRVPSNSFLIVRHGTPGVCLTFFLIVGVGRLLFRLSLALGTVKCTEGLTFRVLEIFGSLK